MLPCTQCACEAAFSLANSAHMWDVWGLDALIYNLYPQGQQEPYLAYNLLVNLYG